MPSPHMITLRCQQRLFERMEAFSEARGIDRTSVLKLAIHYYLNVHHLAEVPRKRRRRKRNKKKALLK